MPRCAQPNCRWNETGICLEGHKQACPHLLPDSFEAWPTPTKPSSVPVTQAKTPASPPANQPRKFYNGEKLTLSEASRLLISRPARIVFCAGPQKSGKTTFLARLGELFRTGQFSDYRFAGSLTLCAFERASWLATIISGSGKAETPRTRRIENDMFLHLQTDHLDECIVRRDLLISDLAGETYPTAIATREFCTSLMSFATADHLILFIDCHQLLDQANRHSERNNAREFLDQVRLVRHEPKLLRVQVVFSKWDEVKRSPQRQTVEQFCRSIEDEFKSRFLDAFASFDFWNISARPDDDSKPTDADLQKLFKFWMESSRPCPPVTVVRDRNPTRDFSGFGLV